MKVHFKLDTRGNNLFRRIKISNNVKLSDQIEKKEEKEYNYRGYVDPYTASLILYRDSARVNKGTVKMFYDDKEYLLPYSVVGREKIDTPAGSFIARKIEVGA